MRTVSRWPTPVVVGVTATVGSVAARAGDVGGQPQRGHSGVRVGAVDLEGASGGGQVGDPHHVVDLLAGGWQ
jgi:hypothetical protein